jgi:hypothetical protein
MQDSLEDGSRVQAVLVGLPDRWPLTELGEMATSLREELHVNIGALVVNGLWPGGLPALAMPPSQRDPDGAVARMFAATTWSAGRRSGSARACARGWRARASRPLARCWAAVALAGVHWPGDLEALLASVDHADLSAGLELSG